MTVPTKTRTVGETLIVIGVFFFERTHVIFFGPNLRLFKISLKPPPEFMLIEKLLVHSRPEVKPEI